MCVLLVCVAPYTFSITIVPSSTTQTFAVYQECWADGRRRVIARKTVVRRTVGEEAAAGFDDAFGGVE